MIDLRSDTVTQPSSEMRAYMAEAPVGDDAYGEDLSVNRLQEYCRDLFQREEALFVTSGMMANRLAFMAQTAPGDEVITEYNYHVNFFDSAPMSAFAGIVFNVRHTSDGIITPDEVERAIHSKQRYDYFAQPKLISVENTINGFAGKIFPLETLKALYIYACENGLSVHLDGARLFNAHMATGIPVAEYARYAHTLSFCFAKGLGAPYGSMLLGSKEVIQRAKKFRVWLGGGIHQGGFQAACGYYALQHHIDRLRYDHQLAKAFASHLQQIEEITLEYESIDTNMVQFSLTTSIAETFHEMCGSRGLHLFPWKPGVFRAVFHRDIDQEQVERALEIIQDSLIQLKGSHEKSAHRLLQ